MKQSLAGPSYPVFQTALGNGVPIGAGGGVTTTFDVPGDQRQAWWLTRLNPTGFIDPAFAVSPVAFASYTPASPGVAEKTTFMVTLRNDSAGSVTPSSNVIIDAMLIQDDTV